MATPGALNPLGALRHRNFRLFWGGQTVSLVGTWMQTVAMGWIALTLTNDPFMVALVSASSSIPVLLFSLGAGVLADRLDKLRVVTIAQTLLLAQAVVLWWLVASGSATIGWLVALAALAGTVNAFEIPARQAFVIEIVGREDLLNAIALNSGGFNLARIVGPSIAAVVIAQLGLEWCFGINAISYMAVLVGLLAIRLPARRRAEAGESAAQGLITGLRYILRTPEVSTLMRLVMVYSIFGIPFMVLMPVIARDVLGGTASTYGSLLTFVGVGALGAAVTLAVAARRLSRGRTLLVSSVGFSVLLIAFSLTRSVWAAALILLGIGFAMVVTNALVNGMLQTIAPDHLRGRVMAAYAWAFIGLGPIGALLSGALARSIGAPATVALFAIVPLVYSLWAFHRNPELRRL